MFRKLGKRKREELELSSEGIVRHYVDKHGKKKVQGGPSLKATQIYPWKFCRKVVKWHSKFIAPRHAAGQKFFTQCPPDFHARWQLHQL